jgi:LPXTG-motif cell wall-anchored protein
VSDDVTVALEFLQRGEPKESSSSFVLEEEETRVETVIPDLAAGRYDVRAVVSDGVDVVTTAAVPVRIRAAAAVSPSTALPTERGEVVAPAEDQDDGSVLPLVLGIALLLLGGVGLVLTRRRGRGLHRA